MAKYMKKKIHLRGINKLNKWTAAHKQPVLVIAAVVVVGLGTLFFAQAAGFSVVVDPVNGVIAGNARAVDGAVQFGGSNPNTGTLNLPRIPWEGGNAYYNQFSTLKNTEWTSPNFFPIMYWGAYIDTQAKANNNASLGINNYGEIYAPNSSSGQYMRNAGIWNLGWNPGGAGSEWVGHMYADEADMWAGWGTGKWTGKWGFQDGVCNPNGSGCAADVYKTQQSESDPADGRVRYLNGGKGMMMWAGRPSPAHNYVNGTAEWPVSLVSTSMYFYTDGGLHGGDPNIPGEATTFFGGVPRDQIRRAANYGELAMTRLRDFDAQDGKYKPLSALVELGQQTGTTNTGAFEYFPMNADRVEGAVWSTLIHEARFVSYFSHSFGTQPTSDALNHPAGNAHYDSVKQRVKSVNGKIKQLAPVLNTQSYNYNEANGDSKFNPGLRTMLKEQGGSFYIFAMQKRAATTSGSYVYTLPAGMPTTGTVEVMFENRTIPISGGKFTDSFAAEFTNHIYKITP